MANEELFRLLDLLDNSLSITDGKAVITDRRKLQNNVYKLAEISALETGRRQGLARYIVHLAAPAFGAVPASINDLYLARGKDTIPYTFSVPAINLRMLTFDAARAVFRVAKDMNAGAFIFEIARSEIGYTEQRPAEYSTSILAAAIAEDFQGPVFLQGDHFQVSAKRYANTPDAELKALRDLTSEAISAGFFNIDIDTSTLVEISQPTVPEQQALNSALSAQFTTYIRSLQPEGITISVGGEIGEVGGHNSTEEELRAYMEGFHDELTKQMPGAVGLSKISIQTGTSHGGVVLPDGRIAQVSVDFDTLRNLSRVARQDYGLGGTVQHGASTLPENAFGKFVEAEAIEVHLATNFQNITFDHLPADLKDEMYEYMNKYFSSERKPGMTDEQFYYKTRKNVIGAFKSHTWRLAPETKATIMRALEEQFKKLFGYLGVAGTRPLIDNTVKLISVKPNLGFFMGEATGDKDVSDMAD